MKALSKNNFIIILIGSLLLVVAGLKMFSHLYLYKDVLCWDEVLYMFRGINITEKVPKGWGPLYGFWYFILAVFQSKLGTLDLVSLNYLNFKILAIACPVLLYIFMVLKRVHPIAAFVISAGYLISTVNTSTWPHISHFTFMFLMLGLIKSHFFKSRLIQWVIILTTVFLTSYARPELFLAFVLLFLAFIVFLVIKKFKFSIAEYAVLLFGFAFIFLVQYKMGIAMFAETSGGTGEYSRDVFAFGQHFAINYFQWHDIDQELWRYWTPYFDKYFVDEGSLVSSGLTNPQMFFKHLITNCGRLLHNTLEYITDALLLGRIFHFPLWLKLIVVGGFVAVSVYIGRSIRDFIHFLKTSEHGFILMVLLFFAAPTYVACVLIYARDHYILLQMPFYLCAIGFIFFLRDDDKSGMPLNALVIIGVGLFLILFAPSKNKIKYFDLWQHKTETYNYKAIKELQQLDVSNFTKEEPVYLLENAGGMSIFTMQPAIQSLVPPINTDSVLFEQLLLDREIDMVFITPSMKKDPIMNTYNDWRLFIEKPEKYNFKKHPIENSATYFLVKNELFN